MAPRALHVLHCLLAAALAACAAPRGAAPPPRPAGAGPEPATAPAAAPAPAAPPAAPAAPPPAPAPSADGSPDLTGWDVATSMAGMFTAAWRPAGGAVPENELFELDLLVFEGAGTTVPLSGAEIVVSAWMPDHMHGMNRRPEVREVEPGRYRVRGMLLHMEGLWQLFIDVIAGGVSERAQFELTLR